MSTSHLTEPASAQATRKPLLDDLLSQYQPTFVDRWDSLINWEKRRESEQDFFSSVLRRANAQRVLDAATGTGFHSIMLADAGFAVTSVDGSREMLSRAVVNGDERGIPLHAVHADWCDLGKSITGQFDAIVCLGSSFPHLFNEADRRSALAAFSAALKPGGLLIIDHRNFDAIRAHRYKSSGRYYYCGTGVTVSVDYVDASICRFRYVFPDEASYTLEVYPIGSEELKTLLADSGFVAVDTYGDFRIDWDSFTPDFLIHIARKV